MSIRLKTSSNKLLKEDIKSFIENLKVNLPDEFYSFYEINNGGVSENNSFYVEESDSYVEISFFYPITYKSEKLGQVSIEDSYKLLIEKNIITKQYLPFAVDWGGNYFCINQEDESVVLILSDMGIYSPKNVRKLTTSFHSFIENLHKREEEDV
jgi:SMI1 / KNR4 family (SUKH-1)